LIQRPITRELRISGPPPPEAVVSTLLPLREKVASEGGRMRGAGWEEEE
jgi:hypothetical protein